jgi:hypothetical protein
VFIPRIPQAGRSFLTRKLTGDPYAESKFANTLKKWGHELHDAYIAGLFEIMPPSI